MNATSYSELCAGPISRARRRFNLLEGIPLEFYGSFRRFILGYSVHEISDSSTEEMKPVLKPENIAQLVYFIRGEKVMLDADLARLYGVSTKALNQALRRNRERFPEDFVFQLTAEEFAFLRSQSVTSNAEEPHPPGGFVRTGHSL